MWIRPANQSLSRQTNANHRRNVNLRTADNRPIGIKGVPMDAKIAVFIGAGFTVASLALAGPAQAAGHAGSAAHGSGSTTNGTHLSTTPSTVPNVASGMQMPLLGPPPSPAQIRAIPVPAPQPYFVIPYD